MRNLFSRTFVLSVVVVVFASVGSCGGNSSAGSGSPTSPTPTPPVVTPKPTVTLTFLQGDTGQPAAGVEVEFPTLSKKATTDSAGQIAIEEPIAGASMMIQGGGGYLLSKTVYDRDRQAFYRWPTSRNGEDYVREVAFNGRSQVDKILRLNTDASVMVGEPFVSDPSVVAALQQAASTISNANGRYRFHIVTDGQAIPGTLAVGMEQGNLGLSYSEVSTSDGLITKAKIFFSTKNSAKTNALREFGMVLGLNKTTFPSIFSQYTTVFEPTSDDLTSMRMIVTRNPMTAWADIDPKFGNK
jgi:hypothetical protein